MQTKILQPTEENLILAAELIKQHTIQSVTTTDARKVPGALYLPAPKLKVQSFSVLWLQDTTQSPGSSPRSRKTEKREVKGQKSKCKDISFRVCPFCKSGSLFLHTDFMVPLYQYSLTISLTPTTTSRNPRTISILMIHAGAPH